MTDRLAEGRRRVVAHASSQVELVPQVDLSLEEVRLEVHERLVVERQQIARNGVGQGEQVG